MFSRQDGESDGAHFFPKEAPVRMQTVAQSLRLLEQVRTLSDVLFEKR
jgi:hypothetical protein